MVEEDPDNNIVEGNMIEGIKDDIITREMVIDKYSYGHIVFQESQNDDVYNTMNEFVAMDSTDYMCAGAAALIEQSEYAVIYDTKKKDKHIKMYFDSEGKLLAVINYKYDGFTL